NPFERGYAPNRGRQVADDLVVVEQQHVLMAAQVPRLPVDLYKVDEREASAVNPLPKEVSRRPIIGGPREPAIVPGTLLRSRVVHTKAERLDAGEVAPQRHCHVGWRAADDDHSRAVDGGDRIGLQMGLVEQPKVRLLRHTDQALQFLAREERAVYPRDALVVT